MVVHLLASQLRSSRSSPARLPTSEIVPSMVEAFHKLPPPFSPQETVQRLDKAVESLDEHNSVTEAILHSFGFVRDGARWVATAGKSSFIELNDALAYLAEHKKSAFMAVAAALMPTAAASFAQGSSAGRATAMRYLYPSTVSQYLQTFAVAKGVREYILPHLQSLLLLYKLTSASSS
jgi:hypothetical protein